ncbi:putative bifunctional diguanylate cyclase/phosphodiesterase [Cryobacterium psychrophilum]|uniref:EAL domain-containing protein n=1 Tax=Cryobacterium psychrophilum TaxID=41988 RepID=A0A4Y8KPZ8_9MICO|nr:EAL domain-containing protein [Cryobacterium psychrophilum]TDW31222.1 PAS domain S-box-containing protein/diguanylate cyclase (GGDEF)-like protein [Cryobacterium psychrophilum]TFD78486.1 EAL domain-containing protein [Cryobacterium psychrophilum]
MTLRTNGNVDDGLASVLVAARGATADIALITDSTQAVMYVSASFTAMTGYEQAELMGRNCRVLQGPGTDSSTRRIMREVLASGEVFEGEILNYRKNGSAFWTALKIIPMRVGASTAITHFVSIQRDISNHVALLKQLQNQALHDSVTGLPNRTAAERAVEEVVKRAPDREVTAAVGLIDLDDFRLVNNTLGHAAGDAVLQQWAARVLSRLREGDVLARMGGDEFILILKNITRSTANEDLPGMLHRVHEAVKAPFTVDGQQVRIGMSLGIALVPEDGTDSRSILRSADEALYTAKERRNHRRTWWETAEHASIHSQDNGNSGTTNGRSGTGPEANPEDYPGALTSGNILVHFQPVVDLREGTVHLFEALARLTLPGGRVAYPDEFLPHLGTDDLRVLFVGVLDRALEILAAWDREGTRHDVSVNLPPAILLDGSIPALVDKLLHAHDIQPGRLGLELLESQVISLDAQRTALRELVALGVNLAMDDLGSGYSSLQRLSSFPFSAIKLDRGLLFHVQDRPLETLSVLATLIQLGRDLGMNVVIEGLENESLTEAATVLGAPLGQGYYFAKPMPPEDCLRWSDSFTLHSDVSLIETPLGALAYHLKFARLAAPHPLELDRCPLTRFLHEANASAEVEAWHAQQHEAPGIHPGSSKFLIDWLTPHIREHSPQES